MEMRRAAKSPASAFLFFNPDDQRESVRFQFETTRRRLLSLVVVAAVVPASEVATKSVTRWTYLLLVCSTVILLITGCSNSRDLQLGQKLFPTQCKRDTVSSAFGAELNKIFWLFSRLAKRESMDANLTSQVSCYCFCGRQVTWSKGTHSHKKEKRIHWIAIEADGIVSQVAGGAKTFSVLGCRRLGLVGLTREAELEFDWPYARPERFGVPSSSPHCPQPKVMKRAS